jgi:ADP-dependent NAD(P)H-hydrate dehydratase / NAD(P)H-hydrate epimerase
MPLPVALYTAAQVRALDARAIALGVAGYTLMKRAGEAALRVLRTRWPMAHRIVIVCGGGNNGGDGYVLARFARAAGLTVTTLAAVPVADLKGAARQAWQDLLAGGGEMQPFSAAALREGEVLVDALLGTGTRLPLGPELSRVVALVNRSGLPVFSLDLPSGLDADAGVFAGEAVRAQATLTFVALKTGLLLADGPEHVGALHFDDLEVDAPGAEFAPRLERLVESELERVLPRRARNSHKGVYGRVLIVGGGTGMPGAVRLAGEAALRVGAGLVGIAAQPANLAAVVAERPELIFHPVADAAQLEPLLAAADVIAIGPGLGRDAWARALLDCVLANKRAATPLIVDADALNLVAENAALRRDDWILTPHPGEAGRLLGIATGQVQAARLASLDRLVATRGGIVVLKGAGTLVGRSGATTAICERGNPGMASAGMGDVLTGTIAGILAQCHDPWDAARAGVLVHALAGDALARSGERGLLAGDVARELRSWVNR